VAGPSGEVAQNAGVELLSRSALEVGDIDHRPGHRGATLTERRRISVFAGRNRGRFESCQNTQLVVSCLRSSSSSSPSELPPAVVAMTRPPPKPVRQAPIPKPKPRAQTKRKAALRPP